MYTHLAGKPGAERPFRRGARRWDDSIKMRVRNMDPVVWGYQLVLSSFERAVNIRVPKVESWLIKSGCDAW